MKTFFLKKINFLKKMIDACQMVLNRILTNDSLNVLKKIVEREEFINISIPFQYKSQLKSCSNNNQNTQSNDDNSNAESSSDQSTNNNNNSNDSNNDENNADSSNSNENNSSNNSNDNSNNANNNNNNNNDNNNSGNDKNENGIKNGANVDDDDDESNDDDNDQNENSKQSDKSPGKPELKKHDSTEDNTAQVRSKVDDILNVLTDQGCGDMELDADFFVEARLGGTVHGGSEPSSSPHSLTRTSSAGTTTTGLTKAKSYKSVASTSSLDLPGDKSLLRRTSEPGRKDNNNNNNNHQTTKDDSEMNSEASNSDSQSSKPSLWRRLFGRGDDAGKSYGASSGKRRVLSVEVGRHVLCVAVGRSTTHQQLQSYVEQAARGEHVRLPSTGFAVMAWRNDHRVKLPELYGSITLPYAIDKQLCQESGKKPRYVVMRKKSSSSGSSTSPSRTRATAHSDPARVSPRPNDDDDDAAAAAHQAKSSSNSNDDDDGDADEQSDGLATAIRPGGNDDSSSDEERPATAIGEISLPDGSKKDDDVSAFESIFKAMAPASAVDSMSKARARHANGDDSDSDKDAPLSPGRRSKHSSSRGSRKQSSRRQRTNSNAVRKSVESRGSERTPRSARGEPRTPRRHDDKPAHAGQSSSRRRHHDPRAVRERRNALMKELEECRAKLSDPNTVDGAPIRARMGAVETELREVNKEMDALQIAGNVLSGATTAQSAVAAAAEAVTPRRRGREGQPPPPPSKPMAEALKALQIKKMMLAGQMGAIKKQLQACAMCCLSSLSL
mmetsp:Transcript_12997/g.22205  ORF Transcript_12997/g.22205 Transcript_12997/m.22205 type:complete len:783 (-) Transcript_12997:607-2955(-)